MVIPLHLVVKDLGFFGATVRDKTILDDGQDAIADISQFSLNLGLVISDEGLIVALRCRPLFDAGNNTPRCTSGANCILVCNRERRLRSSTESSCD